MPKEFCVTILRQVQNVCVSMLQFSLNILLIFGQFQKDLLKKSEF